jgi:PIN domain nuclease of toxin-antitoxin system
VILLDTCALLYMQLGHRRARALGRFRGRIYVSPVTLLELQLLTEVGRGRWRDPDGSAAVLEDPRWALDDPSTHALVEHALGLGWARDPFDRLLVAHARMRGWRLATSDERILAHVPGAASLAL